MTKNVEIRPAIMRFAQLMERELRENDYKGGWEDMSDEELVFRTKEELMELERAMHTSCPYCGDKMKHLDNDDVRSEAADVANFLMMIVDNRDTVSKKKPRGN